MKTILLIGKNGQIGWELQRALVPMGRVVAVGKEALDLADPSSITKTIRDLKPDFVVNAAAYTAVDMAESQQESAFLINAKAPEIIAEETKKLGIPLIHYSSDYVFDGASRQKPYTESDAPNPINIYGKTKLEGEKAIQASGSAYVILRTSWIYDNRGRNFYKTMLNLSLTKKELRVVNDQTGIPNWARSIAEATALLMIQAPLDIADTFHLSCQQATTWYGFAYEILKRAKPDLVLSPITTAEYPTAARRPPYSALNSDKIYKSFRISLPAWQEALSLCMNDLKSQS